MPHICPVLADVGFNDCPPIILYQQQILKSDHLLQQPPFHPATVVSLQRSSPFCHPERKPSGSAVRHSCAPPPPVHNLVIHRTVEETSTSPCYSGCPGASRVLNGKERVSLIRARRSSDRLQPLGAPGYMPQPVPPRIGQARQAQESRDRWVLFRRACLQPGV